MTAMVPATAATRAPSQLVPACRSHPCWPRRTTPRRLGLAHCVRLVLGCFGHNHGHKGPYGDQMRRHLGLVRGQERSHRLQHLSGLPGR
jgi:hypothetical protein